MIPAPSWSCSPLPQALGPLMPLCSPLWVVVVNHVLAAGCQLVDGLGVVSQGLLQYLMLLHLGLGAQLILGTGQWASGRVTGRREAGDSLALPWPSPWLSPGPSCVTPAPPSRPRPRRHLGRTAGLAGPLRVASLEAPAHGSGASTFPVAQPAPGLPRPHQGHAAAPLGPQSVAHGLVSPFAASVPSRRAHTEKLAKGPPYTYSTSGPLTLLLLPLPESSARPLPSGPRMWWESSNSMIFSWGNPLSVASEGQP